MAVSPDPANITTGPGTLWQAPLGTDEPANHVVDWPAGWTRVGYTAEGSQSALAVATADVVVAELIEPVKTVTTGRSLRVGFAMAELTLSKLRLALNGGNVVGMTAAVVNNKALTANVATLTTAAAHGFIVGDEVTVADVDATFNGTYTITVVGSATTFSYAKTAANVVSVAATGVAHVGTLGSWLEPPEIGEEVRTMLGFDSEDRLERIIWRKCFQAGSVNTPRRKGAEFARFPVEFAVERPAGGLAPFRHGFDLTRVA